MPPSALKQVSQVEQRNGATLQHTLLSHTDVINAVSWSPDGRWIASCSSDKTVCIWDATTGKLQRKLGAGKGRAFCVTWSPDGRTVATGTSDSTIRLWNAESGQLHHIFSEHTSSVRCISWSPNGRWIVSAGDDNTVKLWDARSQAVRYNFLHHTDSVRGVAWAPNGWYFVSAASDCKLIIWSELSGTMHKMLTGHSNRVSSVTWSPDGNLIASGSYDNTIRIWDARTGRQLRVLENHTASVRGVCFSYDGLLLFSKSSDNTVCIWRCDTWEKTGIIKETVNSALNGISVHPSASKLATLGDNAGKSDRAIRIWNIDASHILASHSAAHAVHYTNAKVVLVGDAGVGKSGLGLVLTGQPFQPTESTHGRHVWTLEKEEVDVESKYKETRETLLWDLAGQPGYRLVHQLHLNEVAVALIVFDARSETDPFAGVRHWDRALSQAQRLQADATCPMQKFLVVARVDRGGVSVSKQRIDDLMAKLNFNGFFETSAKEGWSIAELSIAMHEAIDWNAMPKVSSTELFHIIRSFLIGEKKTGRVLSSVDDLYRTFLKTRNGEAEDLRAEFETCIGRLEAQGLIRRLSFGDLILLQPEMLDAYASALVDAARAEPDGMGSIAEDDALAVRFKMSPDERIENKEQEKLLLIATLENMLGHEIALREHADEGPYIVFPSQFTRENPDLPDPEGKSVIYDFSGPIINIYATLAVRLSHSGIFSKEEMWKNAATYKSKVGGTCGIYLRELDEGRGELTLFFDKDASEETKFQFEEYIQAHLQRRSLSENIQRRRVFICDSCATPLTNLMITRRRERGFASISCPVCSENILLLDREERLEAVRNTSVPEMDRAADNQRQRETAVLTIEGKITVRDYDVFLCHNSKDKASVKNIGQKLKDRGILPWLDEWELQPGLPWQPELEKQIESINAVAVFVGPDGMGPWQEMEQQAFIRQFVERQCPVIPVILPNCNHVPKLPALLSGMTWVDFRQLEPDPMQQLIWGITGEQSS